MPEPITDPMDLPGDSYVVTKEMIDAVDPQLHPEMVEQFLQAIFPHVEAIDDLLVEATGADLNTTCTALIVSIHGRTWSVASRTNNPQALGEVLRGAYLDTLPAVLFGGPEAYRSFKTPPTNEETP